MLWSAQQVVEPPHDRSISPRNFGKTGANANGAIVADRPV